MIYKLLFFLFLSFSLYAKTFTVASYNVENFFDLHHDKTEYKEFIPNTKSKWNKKTFRTKKKNLVKVITNLNKDIIALQEIESQRAFASLVSDLKQYPYHFFYKNKKSSVGLSLLSRFPIVDTKIVSIKYSKIKRPIVETTLQIDNKKLLIFNNHWPSKRQAENERILYAQALDKRIKQLNPKQDYIILGDLNSNYNENETFKYNKKLNNTYNITGINDILYTTIHSDFIKKIDILEKNRNVHYNLWLEQAYKKRFSYKYKGENATPDNILLPKALFDNKGISYVQNSFNVFKPSYLIKKNRINRWKIKNKVHQNKGFSDHLPIFATFSTKKSRSIKKEIITKINSLYQSHEYTLPLKVSKLIVIYKHGSSAILKQMNNRAIYTYKNASSLKLGYEYQLNIHSVKRYNGLLEMKEFVILKETKFLGNKNNLYLDGSIYDIQNSQYQNEIITNLQGSYQNHYFYYKHNNQLKKIRLYAKDKKLLPRNGQKITIINAHLGFYKSKPQINLYKQSDINVD